MKIFLSITKFLSSLHLRSTFSLLIGITFVNFFLVDENLFALVSQQTGTTSLGLIGGVTRSQQNDLNALRTRANARANGISTGTLEGGWEGGVILQKRVPNSVVAFQFRPSFFYQKEKGTGGTGTIYEGSYEYGTSGYTIAALIKLYPLESNFIRLFFQAGVVWGKLTTQITESTFDVEAKGSNLGYVGGLGVEFCMLPHCLILEAGARVLFLERNIVSLAKGIPAGDSITQYEKDQELEYDHKDLQTNMSGVQTFVGYTVSF
ncbi:MAG: hypothetical protein HQK51_05225 [Oligoflexia bacterium]|nr:hypothetical protein [Oligoflexia bacterium]